MQELYNGLASKVYDVLAGYSQQHGYTLVLDVAQQQNPVLYASESTNITKQIIDAYNLKSGVPAPPPGLRNPPGRPPSRPSDAKGFAEIRPSQKPAMRAFAVYS